MLDSLAASLLGFLAAWLPGCLAAWLLAACCLLLAYRLLLADCWLLLLLLCLLLSMLLLGLLQPLLSLAEFVAAGCCVFVAGCAGGCSQPVANKQVARAALFALGPEASVTDVCQARQIGCICHQCLLSQSIHTHTQLTET